MKKLLLALGVSAVVALRATAGTIDFENMPQAYWYYGGQQNFGNYWAGVNFGPDSTILEDQVYGYNNSGYPPHSGHAVLFSINTPYIDAVFDNPVNFVSFWYTVNNSGNGLFIDAYNSSNVLIDTVNGPDNYGTNSYLEMDHGSNWDIKWIRIHDSGNFFTIDDFTSPSTTGNPRVPESGATMALLGLSVLSLFGIRRKLA